MPPVFIVLILKRHVRIQLETAAKRSLHGNCARNARYCMHNDVNENTVHDFPVNGANTLPDPARRNMQRSVQHRLVYLQSQERDATFRKKTRPNRSLALTIRSPYIRTDFETDVLHLNQIINL